MKFSNKIAVVKQEHSIPLFVRLCWH